MIEKGTDFLKKHYESVAYLFIGGTTVLVNLAVYWMCLFVMTDIPANTIAFFTAVMYAYFTNCLIVFRKKLTWANFFQFWGMRIGTLVIDNGGLWLLLQVNCPRLLAKIVLNVTIIILNYIFSKFFIFKRREEK